MLTAKLRTLAVVVHDHSTNPPDQTENLIGGLQQLAISAEEAALPPPAKMSPTKEDTLHIPNGMHHQGPAEPRIARKKEIFEKTAQDLIFYLHEANWLSDAISWIVNCTVPLANGTATEEAVNAFLQSQGLAPNVKTPASVTNASSVLDAFAAMDLNGQEEDRKEPLPPPCPDVFLGYPTAGMVIEEHSQELGYDVEMCQELLERELYFKVTEEDIQRYFAHKGLSVPLCHLGRNGRG